jgi:hypothetical protein
MIYCTNVSVLDVFPMLSNDYCTNVFVLDVFPMLSNDYCTNVSVLDVFRLLSNDLLYKCVCTGCFPFVCTYISVL